MARCFREGRYSVYVIAERGGPHHRAHAHIKHGGSRVASIFLETLEIYHQLEDLPATLVRRLQEEQTNMLALWDELNRDDGGTDAPLA